MKEQKNKTEICMRILKVNNEKVCIKFKMINGLKEDFIKLFIKYEEKELEFANDSIIEEHIISK